MQKVGPVWIARCLGGFCTATLFCLYAVNLIVLRVAPDHYREVIQSAASNGSLVQTVPLPLGSSSLIYAHESNDCILLRMLVYPRKDAPFLGAISPVLPTISGDFARSERNASADGYPPFASCTELSEFMLSPQNFSVIYYHRYLHGPWSYLGLFLAFLSIKSLTVVYVAMSYGLSGFIILLAYLNIRKHRKFGQPFQRDLAFFVLSLTLLLFSGMNVFSYSFTYAPPNLVVWAFLILCYFWPLAAISERRFVVVMIAFGCFTAAFEFMTGGIIIGLTAFLVMLVLGGDQNRNLLFRRAVLGGIVFSLAIGLCFALKMLVVVAVWGRKELAVFQSELALRMGSQHVESYLSPLELRLFERIGVNPSAIERHRAIASIYAFVKLAYSSFVLAFGSHVLGALVIGGGWVAAVVSNWRALVGNRYPSVRPISAILLVAALIAPAWYLVFPNHSIIHSYFMVRPLAWAPGLFFVGFIYRKYSSHLPERKQPLPSSGFSAGQQGAWSRCDTIFRPEGKC